MLSWLRALRDYVMGVPANLEAHALFGQPGSFENGSAHLFPEKLFTKLLALERKRAERSRKIFALMLLDASGPLRTARRDIVLARLLVALSASTRETDVWGWHKEGSVIGVILTELGSAGAQALRNTMLSKLRSALRTNLKAGQCEKIHISFHVFPEQPGSETGAAHAEDTPLELYPDLQPENDKKKAARLIERLSDICGSLAAVILLSPPVLAIAAAIKLTP
jgi:hypothetical protein